MSEHPHLLRLFVYGTLKPGGHYYRTHCAGKTVREIPAQVHGRLYHLAAGYPALLQGAGWVKGYLLEFRDSAATVLRDIDELEDFSEDRPSSENEYQRVPIEVFTPRGESLGTALTYLMSREQITAMGGVPLPTGEWDHVSAPPITYQPLLNRIGASAF